MNCAQHPELPAVAYCRECGKPLCRECQRPSLGSVYCEAHAPVAAEPTAAAADVPLQIAAAPASSPYAAPFTAQNPDEKIAPDPSVHPVLALLLGFIPGVGAIYNGQYAKGLVHAVVFGLLVSTAANSHNEGMDALVGIMIAAWVFYMVFEAYHTARKRRYGLAVEEFSSQFDFKMNRGRFPGGALVLIGVGFILLLDTTGIIPFDEFERYWPVGLIAVGVWMLYSRLNPAAVRDEESARREARQ